MSISYGNSEGTWFFSSSEEREDWINGSGSYERFESPSEEE